MYSSGRSKPPTPSNYRDMPRGSTNEGGTYFMATREGSINLLPLRLSSNEFSLRTIGFGVEVETRPYLVNSSSSTTENKFRKLFIVYERR